MLYNAFLNDITTEDQRDKVSSQGYALDYLGGAVLLSTLCAYTRSSLAGRPWTADRNDGRRHDLQPTAG